MPFAIPRIWWEPTNHLNGCYFLYGRHVPLQESKNKRSIVYPSMPSSIAPVPHCEDLPIPKPSTLELPSCARTYSEGIIYNYIITLFIVDVVAYI